MKKIAVLGLLATLAVSCDNSNSSRTDSPNKNMQNTNGYNADDTGTNTRDANWNLKTPFDQSESVQDRTLTQKLRQAIMSDSSLSTNAQNIKIITVNGVVTLRGPVASQAELQAILQKVNSMPGILQVNNQLEVAP